MYLYSTYIGKYDTVAIIKYKPLCILPQTPWAAGSVQALRGDYQLCEPV